MSTSRRTFIKNSFGLTSIGILAPSLLWRSSEALAQLAIPDPGFQNDPITQARLFKGFDQHNVIAGFDVTKATIILPDAPLEVHHYAAQELVEHVQKASGFTLPISDESTFTGDSPKIYIGPVQELQKAGIAAVPPSAKPFDISSEQIKVLSPAIIRNAKEVSEKLWLASLPKDATADSIDFIIDLGMPQNIESITLKNRADTITNLNINAIRVEIGTIDDGKNFNRVVGKGELQPEANAMNAVRTLKLDSSVKVRYLRIKVLSNFFGKINSTANTNSIQWQSFGYLSTPIIDTAPASLQRLDALPANAFLMESRQDALFLAGRDEPGNPLHDDVNSGTLFAVYEWLERQLGVRWVWPGELGTHIPVAAKVLSGAWKVKRQPPFLHTRMRQSYGKPDYVTNIYGMTPALRNTVLVDEITWYRRNRFARGVSLEYGHGYIDYWQHFHETHSEYFNLLPDGTRRSDPTYYGGAPSLISMSVGDPELHQQVIDDWAKMRTKNLPWINGWENDTNGKCTCPECLAWDVRDPALGEEWNHRVANAKTAFLKNDPQWDQHLGSMSDRYARWYLALQSGGRKIDPSATVIGGAYANYSLPPLQTTLNPNIVIGVVPTYGWPEDKSTFDSFKSQWLGWHKTGASIYLRPNYTLYGHEQPLATARQWAADFQLAAQNGMIATDYDSLTSMWATQGASIYTLTRLHWRPEMTADDLLAEYATLFGPAQNVMKRYLTFWEERTQTAAAKMEAANAQNEKSGAQLFSSWADFFMLTGNLFSENDFQTAFGLLDQATSAAAGNAQCQRRIAFVRSGLEDADLVAKASLADDAFTQNGNQELLAQAINQLDQHRTAMVKQFPGALNLDLASWMENRHWDRLLYRAMAQNPIVQELPVEWHLRWDPTQQRIAQSWFASPGNDADWLPVRVDSAYNRQPVHEAWIAAHNGASYLGKVWYRTSFEIDPKWQGKVLSLLFGAVDEAATVYLNGVKIGEHPFTNPNDWQTPFTIPLGNAARFNGPNELIVLVENNIGDGGIWKPVWIVSDKKGN